MFDRDPKAEAYGVTNVENLFIRDYLPAATGDQVKVYLWGLYQSGRPQGPIPPSIFASSRTPIWRSSMRVRKTDARSFTSSLMSFPAIP